MIEPITIGDTQVTYSVERMLTGDLAEAKSWLTRALAILDAHQETEVACLVCEAIERMMAAPSTIEQWHLMTGRNPDGSMSI